MGIARHQVWFRLIDRTKDLPTQTHVEQYVVTDEAGAAIKSDISREWLRGWLFLVPRTMVAFLTPVFAKPESDKVRIIKDGTKAEINQFCLYHRTAMMSIKHAIPYLFSFAYQFKVDVDSAFRNFAIHPDDTKFFNYKVHNRFFRETRVPFGCTTAPEICNRITALVRLIVVSKLNTKDDICRRKLVYDLLIFVDDFYGSGTLETSWLVFNCLIDTLHSLGLPASAKPHKSVQPIQNIKWIGFTINTNTDGQGKVTIKADPDKIRRLRNKLFAMANSRKASRKDLERLLGLMVHVTTTIYGAKAFYKNILAICNDPTYNGVLDAVRFKSFQCDARFWGKALNKYDGETLIVARPCVNADYISTDACIEPHPRTSHADITEVGIGCFIAGEYLSIHSEGPGCVGKFIKLLSSRANKLQKQYKGNFPCNEKIPASFHIAYLELFCIWWFISTSPERWAGRMLPIYIDNSNNLAWLLKETAPIPYLPILRPMHDVMMQHRIRLYPILIKSEVNIFSDLASRGQLKELQTLIAGRAWRLVRQTEIFIEIPNHTRPGPLYLFKHEYADGREVSSADSENILIHLVRH